MDLSMRIFKTSRGWTAFWGRLVLCGLIVAAQHADLRATELSSEKLEKLNLIRMQQIPLMEQFLLKYPNSPKRPDTLFRLGEALFETAKYHELRGDLQGSLKKQDQALKVLEELRTQYPHFARLDEALFVLANTYVEQKKMQEAGAVLADIADRFPDSPVIQQASLLLGDHYFSVGQFSRAESYYLKALDDAKMSAYVQYKLGWSAQNMDQPAKALKWFEATIKNQSGAGDYSKDAVREMIWPAIEVHGAQNVARYLEGVIQDPQLLESSLNSLAQGLVQRGENKAAAQVYDSLRTRFASSGQSSDYLMGQIKAEEALGRPEQVAQLVSQISTSTEAATPESLKMLLSSAQKFHSEGQKSKDPAFRNQQYDMAIVYYRAYVSKIPANDIQSAQANFYLGEALYAREKLSEAALAYENASQVVSPIQSQAAWNWLLTAEKLANGFQHKGKEFRQTSANDEKYLAAVQIIQNIAGITMAQKIRASYQAARLLYQLNDYDRALPAFKHLAENMPNTQEGKLSAQLVLDIYNLKNDYKQVAEYAKKLSSSVDSGTRAEFVGIEQKAALKSIQEEEKQAKSMQGSARLEALKQVGRKYLEYSQQYPTAQQVDDAVWAAFVNLTEVAADDRSSDPSEMKTAFRALTQNYSASKHVQPAVNLMGKFLSMRRLDDQELRDFRRYRDQWARLIEKENRSERGPMTMLVYRLSTDAQRSSMEFEMAKLPMSESNREAIATGRLKDIVGLSDKMEKVSMKNLKTLQKNTVSKVNLLEQLKRDVTEIANLKVGEVTVKALQVLANAYLHMSSTIRTAPIPSQLTGENLRKYQDLVLEKAQTFETQGQEARTLAEKTARDLNLSGT
jgi:TolA-binding protein